jgi:protein-tyrosine phosphatase
VTAWQKENREVFECKKEHKKELKHIIRLGIPDDIRGEVVNYSELYIRFGVTFSELNKLMVKTEDLNDNSS